MPDPTPDEFRAVMARFATGVSVMTSIHDGVPHGMTANALASVSLDPLLVLVCVERDTVMADMVADGGVFALSFLPASQVDRSERFADPDRPVGTAQFDGVGTATATTGAPILDGCLGWVDCEVVGLHDGGDHVIVVGRVVDLALGEEAPALVYFRSTYGEAHVTGEPPPGR